MLDRSDEILAPLFRGAGVGVHRIKMRLEITIRSGYITDVDAEQDMLAVVGPAQIPFHGLIMRHAAGGLCGAGISACQIDKVNFVILEPFLALVYRGGHESDFAAIR